MAKKDEKKVKEKKKFSLGKVIILLVAIIIAFVSIIIQGGYHYNTKVNKMREQMAGIKNQDDLLKRDIEIYIKTTFPKVPKVVAKTTAYQIVELSKKYYISPELVLGIIKVESAFNPMSVGPKTKYGFARGLMQVMPEWCKKYNIKSKHDLHDIDIGIETGIKVLLIHIEEGKGDISTGLYYYVNKDKSYVSKVYEAMGKFVAFRSTIDESNQKLEDDIENNGNGNSKDKEIKKEEDKPKEVKKPKPKEVKKPKEVIKKGVVKK